MIHAISVNTTVEAWLSALNLLLPLSTRSTHNVILEIADPIVVNAVDMRIIRAVDAFLVQHNTDPVSTVAGLIFPASHYRNRGAKGVLKDFPGIYPKIRSGWGTYAGRMLSRIDKHGIEFNPLEKLIEKLKKQLQLPGPLKRAYELNLIDPFLDLSIFDQETDANLTIRQPCLSHLSFKLVDEKRLMLTALYRSHYYIQRALGNLLGLSQLLFFVASEAGLEPGQLVCHSSFACLDAGNKWKVSEVKELIATCNQLRTEGIAA